MENGTITKAGALNNPLDTAVITFNCENEETIKEFIKKDPYVTNNLVTSTEIREWLTVSNKK